MIFSHIKHLLRINALPNNMLLLITNPRSGSTWLFDSLRCHPAIKFIPRANIFEYFDLKSRRYPIGLSNTSDSKLSIEIRPRQWEKVPEFKIKEDSWLFKETVSKTPYAIEKFHPDHFEHNVIKFSKKIKQIEKKINFKFIYLVREPKSSMVSFLNYQTRNPKWSARIVQSELPLHMLKIYDSISKVATENKGLIIDYGELIYYFDDILKKVFKHIWPESQHDEGENIDELLKMIKSTTKRDKRQSKGKDFLGKKPGAVSGDSGQYPDFFSKYHKVINQCEKVYKSLLSHKIC